MIKLKVALQLIIRQAKLLLSDILNQSLEKWVVIELDVMLYYLILLKHQWSTVINYFIIYHKIISIFLYKEFNF